MEIIPAIDLRGGKAVRLYKGEYEKETVYFDDPAEVARSWQEQGASRIHLVDLDGARDGQVTNKEALQRIRRTLSVDTELGGGLRDMAAVERVLTELDITYAILGSVLLEKPELAFEAAKKYPDRVILGIDARNGNVATRGWREDSSVKAVELVNEFKELPVAAVIYTDIARDGTLEGPNYEAQLEMAKVSPFPVIASGGVGNIEHVRELAKLTQSGDGRNITGVIIGKALYEKKFTVHEAIESVESL